MTRRDIAEIVVALALLVGVPALGPTLGYSLDGPSYGAGFIIALFFRFLWNARSGETS